MEVAGAELVLEAEAQRPVLAALAHGRVEEGYGHQEPPPQNAWNLLPHEVPELRDRGTKVSTDAVWRLVCHFEAAMEHRGGQVVHSRGRHEQAEVSMHFQ